MKNQTYNQIIRDAQEKVKGLAKQNNWLWFYNLHQKEVIIYAEKLLKIYKRADSKIVIISCWLHDIAHYYATNSQEILEVKENHHIKGAEIAEKFLKKYKISKEEIDKIKNCIIRHRNKKPNTPKTLEEKIMVVADTMSHFGSIFYFTYFKFHPERTLEQMAEDDLAKLKRDWRDINILPKARLMVEKEYRVIKKLFMNYNRS
jgi:uncharacterized protein